MSDFYDRSFSVEAEAQNAAGAEISVEVTVESADDLPAAVAAVQAAVAAFPAGYSVNGPDEDEG